MKDLVKILMFGCIAFILVITACTDNDPEDQIITDPPEEVYPITIKTSMTSNYALDKLNYPITIFLPKAFETNRNIPIIYILDGKMNMQKAKDNVGSNTEAIFVGIGDLASKEEWNRRWIDFSPTGTTCGNGQGKHLNFYNFITKQLIPNIEKNYGINPSSRTLIGHSAAGIFTLVSLFLEDPKNVMFHNFIASDPILGCDSEYFIKLLDDNDFSNVDKKFKLYLAISIEGSVEVVKQFSEKVKEKEFSWLTFKYEEFFNEYHMSVVDPSFKSGLKFVFDE